MHQARDAASSTPSAPLVQACCCMLLHASAKILPQRMRFPKWEPQERAPCQLGGGRPASPFLHHRRPPSLCCSCCSKSRGIHSFRGSRHWGCRREPAIPQAEEGKPEEDRQRQTGHITATNPEAWGAGGTSLLALYRSPLSSLPVASWSSGRHRRRVRSGGRAQEAVQDNSEDSGYVGVLPVQAAH